MQLFHSLKNTFAYTKTFFQAAIYYERRNVSRRIPREIFVKQTKQISNSFIMVTQGSKNLLKVRKITLEQRSVNVVLTLFWSDFEQVLPGWAV